MSFLILWYEFDFFVVYFELKRNNCWNVVMKSIVCVWMFFLYIILVGEEF